MCLLRIGIVESGGRGGREVSPLGRLGSGGWG